MSHPHLSRRQLLSLMGASAVTVVATACGSQDDSTDTSGGSSSITAKSDPLRRFRHGVASGEPLPNAVVIWTRVTPSDEALPGTGKGAATEVFWEIARDAEFKNLVQSGKVMSSALRDHTLHIDVTELQPSTSYWYRFATTDGLSPTGRTKTAPALNAKPAALRFGMVTCAEYEFGFFAGYRHLADRNDIEAVLHMGDYIYEFGTSYGPVATPGESLGRVHNPPKEITTLSDYRTRYGQYRSDPDLQKLHARHPFITIYDDHEIANDWWREGAENHDDSEGVFIDRLAAGLQAWREWLPLRPFSATDPLRAWRRMQFGDLVDLWAIDTRLYRDQQPSNAIVGYGSVDPAVESPTRTILGAEQKAWLKAGLASSTARWKVLSNQVPFYPFVVGAALPGALEQLIDPLDGTIPPLPATLTVEDWNGYRAEQQEMVEVMAAIQNVVVLTGDYHESFAAEVPQRPGDYRLDGNSVAVEFICPSITSPGLSETLEGVGIGPLSSVINPVFELNLTLANPWVKYHEGFSNGYSVIEFGRERTQMDYWFVEDRSKADTAVRLAASWEVRQGAAKLIQSAAPLTV